MQPEQSATPIRALEPSVIEGDAPKREPTPRIRIVDLPSNQKTILKASPTNPTGLG